MSKKYTSAEANKLLRALMDESSMILNDESNTCTFHAAVGESIEDVRPEYSFSETTRKLNELKDKMLVVKHAINVFNVSTVVPGTDGLTVDQVLVLLPKMTQRQKKLREMVKAKKMERVSGFRVSGNIIDYIHTNFDREEVKAEYERLTEELNALRMNLDLLNNTVAEVEIDI